MFLLCARKDTKPFPNLFKLVEGVSTCFESSIVSQYQAHMWGRHVTNSPSHSNGFLPPAELGDIYQIGYP